jgi:ATP-dependent helicase/nuclease subunit A
MSSRPFTPAQDSAVRETGRSLLISAAAGSGKTTVLAERCARLICEPVDGEPCEAADLLVVTFTDAAAAEMRERIHKALRTRLDDAPPARRQHVEEQLALLPAAPISTIHSFCGDLIRRWFTAAKIDPRADILDADEARLLQYETLEAVFDDLYGSRADEALRFQRLVEEDFNGSDTALVELVLRVHEFFRSLPDADTWLDRVGNRLVAADPDRLAREVHELRNRRLADELAMQHEWVSAFMEGWSPEQVDICGQLQQLATYCDALREWEAQLAEAATPEAVDRVCAAINAFTVCLPRGGSRSRPRLDEPRLARAKEAYERVQKSLLPGRLKDRCARFTFAGYLDGQQRVATKQQTLAQIVSRFAARYADAKRTDNVLDFSDLEHFAYRILSDESDRTRPSDVARRCHERYRYVLVDEFQDINPVQEAILRLVSRETDDERKDNLFAVGDVKQCIYAFRLAEPKLFLTRADRFRDGDEGLLIPLRENFRSRPGVLNAVNALFERCMTKAFAHVDYDADAALRPGRKYPSSSDEPAFADTPVELHLLETPPRTRTAAGEEGSEGAEDAESADSALDWHRAEREAYLIAQRIRDFMGLLPGSRRRVVYESSKDAPDGFVAREIQYRDIVILLRAPTRKADRIAEVLQQMDIPVHADVRSGYFDTAELRDMLALLQLLDNGRQDIPLAAVLRSPLAAPGPFSASDLAKIRACARGVPFHTAAMQCARDGPDTDLRDRLAEFHARIERFRVAARRRSLADVIWEIYEETGYLAYVGGLPHGRQRRANLIGLHDRARQFGTFRRQGLRRFLRFVEQLQEQEADLATPSAASEADDVVRVLSVHQSKGLEFPVVFVTDLGARFNLADANRSVVMHREAGIGMKVVDPQRNITYPSLAYQAVVDAVRRDTLAEELRILYVAMTRAKEHLVLVGTAGAARIAGAVESLQRGASGAIDLLTLTTASSALDWVIAAVSRLPTEAVLACGAGDAARRDTKGIFAVWRHDLDALREWRLPEEVFAARREELARIAALAPLPGNEPVDIEDDEVRRVIERIEYHYGPLAMTTVPARQTVTELKRQFDPFTESEERAEALAIGEPAALRLTPHQLPVLKGGQGGVESRAAERGTMTHRFLQRLDLAAANDERSIRDQFAAFQESGRLPANAEDLVDVSAVAWFLGSELGRRLRAAANQVRREVTFVARIQPTLWDATLEPHDAKDVILVRGMIDALLPTPDGIEIIDYKTDAVTADQVADRAARYDVQVDMYARAAADIWRRPVTARWLVFLSARQIVPA